MVSLLKISQIEHNYPFEDAVVETDVINGAFGEVNDGKFEVAANAAKAIAQVEVGDNAGLDVYPILKNSHVRVIDFTKLNGEFVQIYGAQLPDEYAVGDKLASNAEGTLEVGSTAAPYFEITKIIANTKGVEAKVVTDIEDVAIAETPSVAE